MNKQDDIQRAELREKLDQMFARKDKLTTPQLRTMLRLIRKYKACEQRIIERLYLIEYGLEQELKAR